MHKPILETSTNTKLIDAIKKYVADISNWNYEIPNEAYTTFELGTSPKILYFGTYHILEPQDSLVDTLQQEVVSFAAKHKGHVVVLVEDWEYMNFPSKNVALDTKGERGLLMYLGDINGFKVIPIDYARSEIFQLLDIKFGEELVDLFAFMYLIKAPLDREVLSTSEYLDQIPGRLTKSFDWIKRANKKYDFKYFDALYLKYFSRPILEDKNKDVFEILDSSKSTHVLSEVFKMYHSVRDENFLYQICANYLDGKNVFVVLGQEHALFSRRFLTDFVANPTKLP